MDEYPNNTIPRGLVQIFNYRFKDNKEFERKGTDYDVAKLKNIYEKLDYRVKVNHDLTKLETLQTVEEITKDTSLTNMSCILTVILSHGATGNNFLTADEQCVSMKELLAHYTDSRFPYMREKPKFFLCQFCRGIYTAKQLNRAGRLIYTDSFSGAHDIKVKEAFTDTTCIYSSQNDFRSFREDVGTPFIDAWCTTLNMDSHLYFDDFVRDFNRIYEETHLGQPAEIQSFSFKKKFRFGDPTDNVTRIDDDTITNIARELDSRQFQTVRVCFTKLPRQVDDLLSVLKEIEHQQCEVQELSFSFLFTSHKINFNKRRSLFGAIGKVMKSCLIEAYTGPWTPSMSLPQTLKRLSVRVEDLKSYRHLHKLVSNSKSIQTLALSIPWNLNALALQPLPMSSALHIRVSPESEGTFSTVQGDLFDKYGLLSYHRCITALFLGPLAKSLSKNMEFQRPLNTIQTEGVASSSYTESAGRKRKFSQTKEKLLSSKVTQIACLIQALHPPNSGFTDISFTEGLEMPLEKLARELQSIRVLSICFPADNSDSQEKERIRNVFKRDLNIDKVFWQRSNRA